MGMRILSRWGLSAALTAMVWTATAAMAGPGPYKALPPTDEDERGWVTRPTNLRLTGGLRVTSISSPTQAPTGMESRALEAQSWPHPRVPINGFSPLVAMVLTDHAQAGEFEWEHLVRHTMTGTPLTGTSSPSFVVGLFDSGSVIDLLSYCDHATLGLDGSWMTGNTIPLQGASGTVNADITYPLGIYANGLQIIQPDGTLDTSALVGHGNVAAAATPPEACGDGPELPCVVGNTFTGFFSTVIRVDEPISVQVGNETYTSPKVDVLPLDDPSVPTLARNIRMNVSGPGAITTASYYGDIFNPDNPDVPWFPTLFSSANTAIPLGGGFYSEMGVLEGEPGPTNPLQEMRVLVDTGAQACIMTTGMAASLSLPTTPDFTIEVLGIGGTQQDVPGYYIDYVKINAFGGALEFSRVPFVVLELSSPDGEEFDGVMGMNLFWNRNIVFDPNLLGDGAIRVSDPVLADADFDRDTDVDSDDVSLFAACMTGPGIPQPAVECLQQDLDGDGDVDCDDWSSFKTAWTGPPIDPPVLPECDGPATMASAISRRMHDTQGFDIDLGAPLGLYDVAVEPRQDGPQQVIVTFDQAIAGVEGLDNTDVQVADAGGPLAVVTGLAITDNILTVNLAGVPDATRVTMSFPGIENPATGLACTDIICFGVLAGDVDGNGSINVFDLIAARNDLTAAVDATTFRSDVDANGTFNVFDLFAVRNRLTNSCDSPCP